MGFYRKINGKQKIVENDSDAAALASLACNLATGSPERGSGIANDTESIADTLFLFKSHSKQNLQEKKRGCSHCRNLLISNVAPLGLEPRTK